MTKTSKSRNKMSEPEKLEARLMLREGFTQQQTADVLGVSQKTISRLKRANKWEKDRLPQGCFNYRKLIQRIQQWAFQIVSENLIDKNADPIRGILNLSRLVGSLRSLEELDEMVSLRDRVQFSEEMMEWMIRRGHSGTLEQIQEFHDEHLAYM